MTERMTKDALDHIRKILDVTEGDQRSSVGVLDASCRALLAEVERLHAKFPFMVCSGFRRADPWCRECRFGRPVERNVHEPSLCITSQQCASLVAGMNVKRLIHVKVQP